jgi:hypothetical protein
MLKSNAKFSVLIVESRPTYLPELNKENEEYQEFLAWKQGMDLKDSCTGINDETNLLGSRGLVFQNLSNYNIVMVSGQANDANNVLDSLGGL